MSDPQQSTHDRALGHVQHVHTNHGYFQYTETRDEEVAIECYRHMIDQSIAHICPISPMVRLLITAALC